jgi:hypothetical protein
LQIYANSAASAASRITQGGMGSRLCLTLVLGLLMRRFAFVDHANYQLKIKESLTLKPDGLTIMIRPRTGRTWGAAPRAVAAAANPRTPALAVAPADRHGTPLLVPFGSNLGASDDRRMGARPRRRRRRRAGSVSRPSPPTASDRL